MTNDKFYKITILGSEDVVKGFKILGVQVLSPIDVLQAQKYLLDLKSKNDCAVLIITEDWAVKLEDFLMENFASLSLPAMVVVPGFSGSTGQGLLKLQKIVEQAVGSDILFNNNK